MLHTEVLYILINNPLISTRQIKNELENVGIQYTYYSIQKAIKELYDWGVLRPKKIINDDILPGKTRTITDVEGNIIPQNIGLVRQHVIFQSIPDRDSLIKFRNFCDLHPYTRYRSQLISNGLSGYAQFDVPIDVQSKMKQIYNELCDYLGCKHVRTITTQSIVTKNPNLHKWNTKNGVWNLNINQGENNLSDWWDSTSSVKIDYVTITNNIDKLDSLDMSLIRELTINGRIKADVLSALYNRERSTITRRLIKLNDIVMGLPRIYFDRKKINLHTPLLIYGDISNKEDIGRLYSMVNNGLLPFRLQLVVENNFFILNLIAPPSQSREIAQFLWNKLNNIEIFTFGQEKNSSFRYYFYPNNFNNDDKTWIKHEEYIRNKPFNLIMNSI